jgi:hypothetical protein
MYRSELVHIFQISNVHNFNKTSKQNRIFLNKKYELRARYLSPFAGHGLCSSLFLQ